MAGDWSQATMRRQIGVHIQLLCDIGLLTDQQSNDPTNHQAMYMFMVICCVWPATDYGNINGHTGATNRDPTNKCCCCFAASINSAPWKAYGGARVRTASGYGMFG